MIKCKVCGGTNIQLKIWMNVNEDTYAEEIHGLISSERWCIDCEKHVEIIDTFDEQGRGNTKTD